MNKKNLELLGLAEGATEEDVKAAYETLRSKYLEERFLDGEAGNNAAKMLTKIEAAYSELMAELRESSSSEGENSFAQAEALIKSGDLQGAQRILDTFNERGGQWHYLQSVIYYRKNWVNESKKQLEIAIQLEPDNEKYRQTYQKLTDKINADAKRAASANNNAYEGNNSAYQGQTMNNPQSDEQMGGNFCANCIECCYLNMCLNCLCSACCH